MGAKGGRILRNPADPNDLTMVFEWDTVDHAQAFAQSPELREVMQKAGVVGKPYSSFHEEVEKVSS